MLFQYGGSGINFAPSLQGAESRQLAGQRIV